MIPSPRSSLAAALVLFLGASLASSQGSTVSIGASMDSGETVPPGSSTGSGNALVTVDLTTNALTLTGSFTGLGSNVTMAHIHGAAMRGQNAGIVVPLTPTGTTSGTLSGNAILSAQQLSDVLAGLTYVNVHTVNVASGEIRGQLDLTPTVDCPAGLVSDPVLSDVAGATYLGPNINDHLECFAVSLDCSGAGAPGIYTIQLRPNKLGAPVVSGLGDLWIGGPKLTAFSGMHNLNSVLAGPFVLPNDIGLVGLSYGIQGFCGGRLSNALQEHIGLP